MSLSCRLLDAGFINQKELSNTQRLGLIKAFDLSFDLAWKVIKDYYQYQGIIDIQGSRDAFRTAFKQGLIEDGETWMSMNIMKP